MYRTGSVFFVACVALCADPITQAGCGEVPEWTMGADCKSAA